MSEFHFIRPEWLLLLPVVAVLVYQWRQRRNADGAWSNVVDSALRPFVLTGPRGGSGARRSWLMGAAAMLAVLALAGPTWERLPVPAVRSTEALVIVLDLSRSMDANDLEPSRLSRARLKILDLLERRESGQVALVVYTAHAFTVTPLTSDHATVGALVGSLSTDIMPSRGSYADAGIRKAAELLEQSGIRAGDVLLITDAVTPQATVAADALVASGHQLHVLGVGTPSGGPIPLKSGGFLTDGAGNLVLQRLEESGLKRLAASGRGEYRRLEVGDADIRAVLDAPAQTEAIDSSDFLTDRWRDLGPYLAVLLLPLVAALFRRGWILGLGIVVLLPVQNSHAGPWQRPDQAAAALMADEEYAAAAELFADRRWKAAALYRSGDFVGSAEALQDLPTAEDHYNRGNALARAGQFPAAVEAYDAALQIAPEHEDAAHNKALLLENFPQDPGGGEGSNEPEDSESQSGESDDSQDSGGDESAGEGEESQGEAEREAQAEGAEGSSEGSAELSPQEIEEWASEQAAEQWLRRIPDDPGGLLRRKFRYQYQRLGRDQDGNEVWPGDERNPY